MTKLSITLAAVLALVLPAGSSAASSARWTTYPTCTATTTALTCAGKAAGVHPKFIYGISPLEVAIGGTVHYSCADPVFDVFFFGYPDLAPDSLASADIHNGKTFSVQFPPPYSPPGLGAGSACLSGVWARDPNYYDVHVIVGWGFGSGHPIEALDAPIGTVSPG
jgi:hypothetical protein